MEWNEQDLTLHKMCSHVNIQTHIKHASDTITRAKRGWMFLFKVLDGPQSAIYCS